MQILDINKKKKKKKKCRLHQNQAVLQKKKEQ